MKAPNISESAHCQGSAIWRIAGGGILTLLMVFGVTKAEQADKSDKPETAQGNLRAESPTDITDPLEELRKAVREQEERVEERREILITLRKGLDDDMVGTRSYITASPPLEQIKAELEIQIEGLLKHDSEQAMVYAAGLNLPGNIVKALYPQYLELQLQLASLKIGGLADDHPTVVSHREHIEGLRRQLEEAIVSMRASLSAQLALATKRIDHEIQRELETQNYVDAKKDFETAQALLQQMRLTLIEKTITARKAAIQSKLESIIIPRVDFEGVSIDEAIDFLHLRSRELDVNELDPTKKGLNLVILSPRLAGDDPIPTPIIKELKLRNVPLETVILSICDQTNFRYEVSDHAVILSPKNEAPGELGNPE